MDGSAHPLLEVKNLATGYGDIRAVWDVSLTVYPRPDGQRFLVEMALARPLTLRAIAG